MSDERESLFRTEALDFAGRPGGPGELVRSSAAWTEMGYWALLALVAAGLGASIAVRVGDEPLLFVVAPALKMLIERLHA
jgi:hypothetical protein